MAFMNYAQLVSEAKKKIRELTVRDVDAKFKRGDRFHFVDIREDEEWNEGHAPGAIHIGRGVLERDIEEEISDKNAEIVLYCAGGSRSALAADVLVHQMGYQNVASMAGGMRDWVAAGLPQEKPSGK